jgi:hypothetical protein
MAESAQQEINNKSKKIENNYRTGGGLVSKLTNGNGTGTVFFISKIILPWS